MTMVHCVWTKCSERPQQVIAPPPQLPFLFFFLIMSSLLRDPSSLSLICSISRSELERWYELVSELPDSHAKQQLGRDIQHHLTQHTRTQQQQKPINQLNINEGVPIT